MARVELRNYRRAQSPLHTLFRLFRYFRHCRVLLICAVASILAYVACTIGASYCMRPLTNLLKESGITPNETYAKYLSLLAGLGTLYFLSAVTNYLLNRLMLETSTVIMRELRAELFARMQKLPISYFDANTNGSLMSYYTNDIEATNELLQHSITQMLISVTSLTGTIAMMLVLSMRLFAIMVVLGAIVLLVVRITTKISSRSYRAQQVLPKLCYAVRRSGYLHFCTKSEEFPTILPNQSKTIRKNLGNSSNLCGKAFTFNQGFARRIGN